MAQSDWTLEELSSTVEAYANMLRAEVAGKPYSKAAHRKQLRAGPLSGRSEGAIEYRMQNISHVLQKMGKAWIKGYKPAANVGPTVEPVLQQLLMNGLGTDPVDSGVGRQLPRTGYWIFVNNRQVWDADGWLRTGETELLYEITYHHSRMFAEGDLGVIRAHRSPRGLPPRPTAIVAIVQVTGRPEQQTDTDTRFYSDPTRAALRIFRVPLRVIANLGEHPVAVSSLGDDDAVRHLKRPLQWSTIPLPPEGFNQVVRLSGAAGADVRLIQDAETPAGVRALEDMYQNLTPTKKERVSSFIERGSVGKRVKEVRQGHCQICEAQGTPPVSFLDNKGKPYSEAHHVHPVHKLKQGSLGPQNIMVLCPNHHRQAHFGSFEVRSDEATQWVVAVDTIEYAIPKTVLS